MKKLKWWLIPAVVVVLIVVPTVTVFAHDEPDYKGSDSRNYGGHCWGTGGTNNRWHMQGFGHMGGTHLVVYGELASTLDLTQEQLTERLAQGETIAQIAEDRGVSLTEVINAAIATHEELLQIHVKYGNLTEAEAKTILGQMHHWIEENISEPYYSFCGNGFYHGEENDNSQRGIPKNRWDTWRGRGGMMGGGMMH